jgi:hypothetical protein
MFTRDSLDGQVHQNKAPGCSYTSRSTLSNESEMRVSQQGGRYVFLCSIGIFFLFTCPPQTHKDFTVFPCSASLHVPCVPCKIFLAHSCSLVPWKPLETPGRPFELKHAFTIRNQDRNPSEKCHLLHYICLFS